MMSAARPILRTGSGARGLRIPTRVSMREEPVVGKDAWTALFASALLFASLGVAYGRSATSGAGLTDAAAAWLASLDADQRRETLYEFDDEERFDLRLAPFRLEGLRRDRMTQEQWQGWRRVLATTLSETGLRKVETVMSLERELEESLLQRVLDPFIALGEGRYRVAMFGEPVPGRGWGFRFDGHHVSLNWTVAPDGTVSTFPRFLGSQPREIPDGSERAGLRALAEEEDAADALLDALEPELRSRAELPFDTGWGVFGDRALFLGAGRRIDLEAPVGLPRADMKPSQGRLLDALIETYLAHLSSRERVARRAAIDAAGRGELHFAWAGSLTPGESGYYRIQGPTLLIEFDNTGDEADHVHTLMRDVEADFGRDLLGEHRALYHAPTAFIADHRVGSNIAP